MLKVWPATYTLSELSIAIARPFSLEVPPSNVDAESVVRALSNFET